MTSSKIRPCITWAKKPCRVRDMDRLRSQEVWILGYFGDDSGVSVFVFAIREQRRGAVNNYTKVRKLYPHFVRQLKN